MPSEALWIALSHASIGSATFVPLITHFGSLEAAVGASDETLLASELIGRAALARLREALGNAETSLSELMRQGVQTLTWDNPIYPSQLYEISSAPPALFLRGSQPALGGPLVAIVGTRQPPEWAEGLARVLAAELAERGLGLVSGLAHGIDAAAHRGALSVPGGVTVVVLGSSHDRLYPANHAALADEIARRGCVLSAYPPGAEATAPQLVARNRITTALSAAVIVVAARPESGSRHAVRFAHDQGRLVLAVPGTAGCDALLDTGAADPLELQPDFDRLALQILYAGSVTVSRGTKKRAGPA